MIFLFNIVKYFSYLAIVACGLKLLRRIVFMKLRTLAYAVIDKHTARNYRYG